METAKDMTLKKYNAMGLHERLIYHNRHTVNWNNYVCLSTVVYDWHLYHVFTENMFGICTCYIIGPNGWNDKNKAYFIKRKDLIICENNDCFIV